MKAIHPELSRLAWWQLRTSVRFRIVLLLALVPLAAGILSAIGDAVDERRYDRYGTEAPAFDPQVDQYVGLFVVYTVLPLTALLLAGGLIADDVEDRTLSYLLVRPIRRSTLYLSKLLPVALATGLLGALQALSIGVTRLVAWLLYGQGSRLDVAMPAELSRRTVPTVPTVDAGLVAAMDTLGAVLACFLLGVALASIFGFVSLAIPKLHYVANLLFYVAIELPFSNIGAQGLGFLTPSLQAQTLMGAFDLTRHKSFVGDLGTAGVVLAAPMLLAIVAFWTWLGIVRARGRDFNVTSAAE